MIRGVGEKKWKDGKRNIVEGEGIKFENNVKIYEGVKGERKGKKVEEVLKVKKKKYGKNKGWWGLKRSKKV